MRDALSIFDRIAGATNNNITYQAVTQPQPPLIIPITSRWHQLLTEDLAAMMLIIDDIMKRDLIRKYF
jgi:DNA polymerase III gamma/tau subunit